jgi:hypothetical protein
MAIPQEVYKVQRLVLTRFRRAKHGDPSASRPDIDDRGYTGDEHGSVVGITEDRTITVRLTREKIEATAPLFVTSSDENVVTVVDPADGALPNARDMDVQLRGISGGNPSKAKVEVRFGSASGPIIHELGVWVFEPLFVRITAHRVTISQKDGQAQPIGTTADVKAIIDMVRAIWRPCGIAFSFDPNKNVRDEKDVAFTKAGVVSMDPWPGEVEELLTTNWKPKTINVYFVHQIGEKGTTGLGIPRAKTKSLGVTNPGIIVADVPRGQNPDTYSWAQTIAHEIGHFFRLEHVERRHANNPREDTWTRRMLMYPLLRLTPQNNWKDDVGYGKSRAGCFITMKNLPQLTTDGECATARKTVVKGPY